jgi:hypothetical protein
MALRLRRGVVTTVAERYDELIRCEVDGSPCVAYPHLTGEVEVGDEVVVNTAARELGLGSGGFDVLYVNLTRGLALAPQEAAHVMSLPYAPGQLATRCAEEDVGTVAELDGAPVVCCGLHSQVAPACAALAGRRVVYVQLAGGALPVSLSDTVRALRARGLVAETVAVAPCFDADLQCVTVASGVATAAARSAEVIVCSIGPGIVGTGTRFGHGGLAVADAANAAAALGGRAVITPRVSFGDARERHRGLSHHTRAALALCLGAHAVAWPEGLEPPAGLEVELVPVDGWLEACAGLELSHMGRGAEDDPWFFASAFAAGRHALRML